MALQFGRHAPKVRQTPTIQQAVVDTTGPGMDPEMKGLFTGPKTMHGTPSVKPLGPLQKFINMFSGKNRTNG